MSLKQLKIEKKLTDRSDVCVDAYLTEISKFEPLTSEEEVRLTKKIKKGDKRAKNKLINANLKFVVSVAKQYSNVGVELSDLISEGNLGLIIAADKFDETKGFKFISFAVWWIRQKMLTAISESRLIRIPQNKNADLIMHRDAIALLEQKLERVPTSEEVAEYIMNKEKNVASTLKNGEEDINFINKVRGINMLQATNQKKVSVDGQVSNQEDAQLMIEILPNNNSPQPDKSINLESFKYDINRAMSILSQKERVVLEMIFGLNGKESYSIESVAFELGYTTERIRQIKNKAIEDMKNSKCDSLLKHF